MKERENQKKRRVQGHEKESQYYTTLEKRMKTLVTRMKTLVN